MRGWFGVSTVAVLGMGLWGCPTPADDGSVDSGHHRSDSSTSSGGFIFTHSDGGALRSSSSSSAATGSFSTGSSTGGASGASGGSSGGGGLDGGSAHPDAAMPHPDAGIPPHPDASVVNPNVPQSCSVWQDCSPHFGDLNSGYECQGGTCVCDPVGMWSNGCVQQLQGTWISQECFCVVTATSAPPTSDPDPNHSDNVQCWWTWHSDGCEPDRWVDTSHYERECNPDCRDVWVDSGYWESGSCTGGRWIKRCDDGTEIWF